MTVVWVKRRMYVYITRQREAVLILIENAFTRADSPGYRVPPAQISRYILYLSLSLYIHTQIYIYINTLKCTYTYIRI